MSTPAKSTSLHKDPWILFATVWITHDTLYIHFLYIPVFTGWSKSLGDILYWNCMGMLCFMGWTSRNNYSFPCLHAYSIQSKNKQLVMILSKAVENHRLLITATIDNTRHLNGLQDTYKRFKTLAPPIVVILIGNGVMTFGLIAYAMVTLNTEFGMAYVSVVWNVSIVVFI